MVPQSEFHGITEVLDSLDQKTSKSMEFMVLFENSSMVGNLVWALRFRVTKVVMNYVLLTLFYNFQMPNRVGHTVEQPN